MLPKRERIVRGSEIKGTIKRKQFHFSSPLLYFVAEANNGPCPRLAVVCSKQLGKATKRNRIRRRVLAAYLKIRHNIVKNIDIVVFPKGNLVSTDEYRAYLAGGLERKGLWLNS